MAFYQPMGCCGFGQDSDGSADVAALLAARQATAAMAAGGLSVGSPSGASFPWLTLFAVSVTAGLTIWFLTKGR